MSGSRHGESWPHHGALLFVAAVILLCIGCSPEGRPPAGSSAAPAESDGAGARPAAASAQSPTAAENVAGSVDPDTQNRSRSKVPVVYSSFSNVYTALYVTAEAGLFEKYGLEVDLTYNASGPMTVQGMLAGETAIAGVGANVIEARMEGSDLLVFADIMPTFLFSMYADPAIATVQDLRGKTIATTRRGAAADQAARVALSRMGLVPDEDITVANVGDVTAVLAAVQQRIAAAGIVSAPTTLRARELGLKELIDISALRVPFPHAMLATSARWAREHPDEMRRFLKAYIEAIKRTREDKPLAMRAIGRFARTEDPRQQEEAYDTVVNVYAHFPAVSPEVIQAALDESQNPNARTARAADFYDNSYVEALRGWTERLYGR